VLHERGSAYALQEKSATTRGVFNSKAWGISNQQPAGPSALLEMRQAKRRAVGGGSVLVRIFSSTCQRTDG